MPVIVSYTRKNDTYFRQPVEYIFRDYEESPTWIVAHNLSLPSGGIDKIKEAAINQFTRNDSYRKSRAKITLYHDIISFSPKDKNAICANPWILEELAREYINLRAIDGMAIAAPHFTDAPHVHVLFSGAEYEVPDSSLRISKYQFDKIKKELERVQQERYPQLKYSMAQRMDKDKVPEVDIDL